MSTRKMRAELKKNGLYLKRVGRHYYPNGEYDLTYHIVDKDDVVQMENVTISDIIEVLGKE